MHWFGEVCGCIENQQTEVCISALRVKVPWRVGWVQCMLRSEQGNAWRAGSPAGRRDAGGFPPTKNMKFAPFSAMQPMPDAAVLSPSPTHGWDLITLGCLKC